MSILERRKGIGEAVIKDRFVRQQLLEESNEMDKAQDSLIARRGFTSNEWGKRSFSISKNKLIYTHLTRHRFVDMKTRQTKTARIKKKSHPIHNKILYGHANNVIKRLHFGFTEAVKDQIAKELEKSPLT